MKKVFGILAVYTAIIFLCCIGETYIYRTIPILIAEHVGMYRFFRGLSWFLSLLPAIFLSGFTVACAVLWQKDAGNARQRFSPAMIDRYRIILLSSLVFVAILAFNAEIFRPLVKAKLFRMESAPRELKNNLSTAEYLIQDRNYELAYMYATRAVAVAPHDMTARNVLKNAKDFLDIWETQQVLEGKTVEEVAQPLHAADMHLTAKELMQRAQSARAEENWLNAHYWATLALAACNGTDTNMEAARTLADVAWNKLKAPGEFENSPTFQLYRKKLNGYIALNQGDNLKAYYIFLDLQKSLPSRDPDVERYFALAKEAVQNQYFFIDEADDMDVLASGQDIHFSLRNRDGSRNVYSIKSVMDSKYNGTDIRYLKDMTVVTYSSSGRFVRSMYVPLAKAISQNVNVMSEENARALGIQSKWKNVPFIMLLSVDRDTQGIVSTPVYSDVETGLTEAQVEELGLYVPDTSGMNATHPIHLSTQNTLILPMPYSDFAVIDAASAGSDTMSIFSLLRFIPNAQNYGFAAEVFSNSLVGRFTYPLFILILFIFAAAVGWNYRIDDSKVQFRTIWLLMVILYGFVTYLIVEVCGYVFNIMNYVLIGVFNNAALVMAFFIYGVIFVLISINFMSRKK